jgi:hypothetical protein
VNGTVAIPELSSIVPWPLTGALLVSDIAGRMAARALPRMHPADATFLLQALIVFLVPPAVGTLLGTTETAPLLLTIVPSVVVSLYLAIDWAKCRIASSGTAGEAAKALETRYSIAILIGYVALMGAGFALYAWAGW